MRLSSHQLRVLDALANDGRLYVLRDNSVRCWDARAGWFGVHPATRRSLYHWGLIRDCDVRRHEIEWVLTRAGWDVGAKMTESGKEVKP